MAESSTDEYRAKKQYKEALGFLESFGIKKSDIDDVSGRNAPPERSRRAKELQRATSYICSGLDTDSTPYIFAHARA